MMNNEEILRTIQDTIRTVIKEELRVAIKEERERVANIILTTEKQYSGGYCPEEEMYPEFDFEKTIKMLVDRILNDK